MASVTSGERAATAGIESGTSSPGVARSTDWSTPPPPPLVSRERERDSLNMKLIDGNCNYSTHYSNSAGPYISGIFKNKNNIKMFVCFNEEK